MKKSDERKPHRQICSLCHREYSIDFLVPKKIWELVTHISQRENLICLDCFTRMADTKFVEWDKGIKFYPVSLVSHIKNCKLKF
jgi:hypothetical protein